MEEQISNTVEMPEYSYEKDERVWEDSGKNAVSYNSSEELYEDKPYEERLYEENLYDMEVKANSTDICGDVSKESNSVLSVEKSDINESVKDMHEDIYGELASDAVMIEPVIDVTGMEAEQMVAATEEAVTDKVVLGRAVTEDTVTGDAAIDNNITQNKLTYEMYCQMTPEEKAKTAGFTDMRSFDTVVNVVQAMFYEMGHKAGIDEIMAEAKVLYEGMEKYVTGLRAAEILKDMAKMEVSYSSLTDKEKAQLFDFWVENNEYNLKLYMAVMKAVGIKKSMDEMYEDYQRIYDKTVEMQMGKETERKNEERCRGR